MSSIYFKSTLNTKITIHPQDLNKNIETILLKKLKETLEGKCCKDGYIKTNSIAMVNRSLGRIEPGYFNGSMIYNVEYSADICNPSEKQLIECNVVSLNKIGVLCIAGDSENQPFKIIIPRQTHLDNPLFKEVIVGTKVTIEVVGSRFEINDSFISIIGILVKIL